MGVLMKNFSVLEGKQSAYNREVSTKGLISCLSPYIPNNQGRGRKIELNGIS